MVKSIYIAGPMSGIPEFNFPAFFDAEERLRSEGWHVWNPAAKSQEAELDKEAFKTGDNRLVIEKGFDFRECYLWDMEKVIYSDAIYMLQGWQYSPGAVGEHAAAVTMKKHYPEYGIIYEPRYIISYVPSPVSNRKPEERESPRVGPTLTSGKPSDGGL